MLSSKHESLQHATIERLHLSILQPVLLDVFELVEITPYVVDIIKTAMVYTMKYTYRQPVCMTLIT